MAGIDPASSSRLQADVLSQGSNVFKTNPGQTVSKAVLMDAYTPRASFNFQKFPSGYVLPAIYELPDQPDKELIYHGFSPGAPSMPSVTGETAYNDSLRIRNKGAIGDPGEATSFKFYTDDSVKFADPNFKPDPYWADLLSRMPVVEYKDALLYPSSTPANKAYGTGKFTMPASTLEFADIALPKLNFEGHARDVWTKSADGTWSKQNFAPPAQSQAPEVNTATYATESRELGQRSAQRRRAGGSKAPGTLLASSMDSGKNLLGN